MRRTDDGTTVRRDRPNPFPTERAFQDAVCEMAKTLGCLVYHTHDSRRSEPGFPDLVIVGRRGVLYRELKQPTGRMSEAQNEWLSKLVLAGQNAAVWRPDAWPKRVHDEIRGVA